MKGFFNRLIIINVTDQTTEVQKIDDQMLKLYMGGKGLATHLLLNHNPPGVDPFSPDNHFIIGLGPVTDSLLYGSCRYGIFSKSPLTGFYGESYSGGKVAESISQTGYDFILLKGASSKPLWIEICDKAVLFHDAEDLWGKDTYETEDLLKERCGQKGAGAMVIGPAGENLVRFAVVENDYWRSAGRTGMGAVLGSKKIKGLVFHGTQKREFHDPDQIRQYSKNMLKELKNHPATETYRNLGTPVMVAGLNNAGAFPTKYWSKGTCEHWEKINAQSMKEKLNAKPRSCRKCFMGCGKYVTVNEGKHKGLHLEGPEYETIYTFGGLCMVDSIEDIVWLNDICDRLGMDTMSAGNLAALTIEASQRGKINEDYAYGDADAVADILFKTAKREGLGGLLAEGIKSAGAEMDMADEIVHVKGLEPAGYDPRVLKGMALAYSVSPRGACHLRSTFYKAELSGMIDPDQIEDKAELFLDFEDRCTLFDTFILCRFYRDFYPWEELSKLFFMTTGVEFSKDELRALASRVTDETRKFNIREGLTIEDDFLPKRLFKEKLNGKQGISEDELSSMIQDYYRLRGWDKNGVPQEKSSL
ncbi:aldehyde ferredoxin oxidoreductase family protein [Desulfobacula toluolica]|uniref:Aor2: tungsten-containing aldehyde ferredoxin oxidoreductase n=1 Tax=Desulfobacula toluolica (strain DSM 7467 / Tol2) TaxID=651182 RepID=K0NCC3_DESTT|nr:aldehyde ferredoxin oxidoreductase family protein [Desulfobacula toluolica]CCK78300.1 Aor2: tungsten-containing aldehyde ferredoxin oxidoreductase [Desulfobacula toluolica Tol2]